MKTYYVVQTFSVNKRRQIQADEPRQAQSEGEALRLAQRLSEVKFGVIAFSRSGDPTTGDWDDAKILYQFGDFPEAQAEELRMSA